MCDSGFYLTNTGPSFIWQTPDPHLEPAVPVVTWKDLLDRPCSHQSIISGPFVFSLLVLLVLLDHTRLLHPPSYDSSKRSVERLCFSSAPPFHLLSVSLSAAFLRTRGSNGTNENRRTGQRNERKSSHWALRKRRILQHWTLRKQRNERIEPLQSSPCFHLLASHIRRATYDLSTYELRFAKLTTTASFREQRYTCSNLCSPRPAFY